MLVIRRFRDHLRDSRTDLQQVLSHGVNRLFYKQLHYYNSVSRLQEQAISRKYHRNRQLEENIYNKQKIKIWLIEKKVRTLYPLYEKQPYLLTKNTKEIP